LAFASLIFDGIVQQASGAAPLKRLAHINPPAPPKADGVIDYLSTAAAGSVDWLPFHALVRRSRYSAWASSISLR
jgi:hypothetical protein